MNVLTLNDVSYKYDGTNKYIFQNVNLQFETGKIYTIVGKSGSGKSTMLSLIAGLDTCTNGEIAYNGKSLSAISRDKYRAQSIGVVFQGFNLLTNATAVENIILSMNISGWPHGKNAGVDKKARAYELLEKVGIDKEKANRKILKLSGGEQQRVSIARALSHDPDLIIADEPTGNLDADTEKSIMKIFTSLARNENKCVIIVTHSKKVSSYADEIWGVNKGIFQFISQPSNRGNS